MTTFFSALVDTDFVLGVDCDAAALQQARINIEELELEDSISLIQARVGKDSVSGCTDEKETKGGRGGGGRGNGGRWKGNRGRGGRGRVSGRSQTNKLPNASYGATAADAQDEDNDCDWIFPLSKNCVDTVLTNPPFGTKPDRAGIDVQFLKTGCRLARRSVYSFHKSSTRNYVLRTARAISNVQDAVVVAEMKFDLPRTFRFHKAASVDVEVDLIRVQLVESDGESREERAPGDGRESDDNSDESDSRG